MARLHTCGFEEIIDNAGLLLTMWNSATSGCTSSVAATTRLSGTDTHSLSVADSGVVESVTRSLVAGKTTGSLWTRAYIYWDTFSGTPNSFGGLIVWKNVGTAVVVVRFNPSTKKFRIDNISTGTSSTTDGTFTGYVAGHWYRVELEIDISTTATGNVILKIYDGDKTAPLDTIQQTNVITLGVSPAAYSGVQFGNITPTGWGLMHLDDIAVNDETTAANDGQTSWCGPGAIFTIIPNGAFTAQWAIAGSSPATTNDLSVDDIPFDPDDGAAYVSTTDTVSYDRFPTLAAYGYPTGSILDFRVADVYGRVGGSSTNTGTLNFRLWDEAGVVSDGPKVFISINGWQDTRSNEHLTVNLSGKTLAQVENFGLGYIAVGGAAVEKRVTAVWANIEYIPNPVVSVSQFHAHSHEIRSHVSQTVQSRHEIKAKITSTKTSSYAWLTAKVSATKGSPWESKGTVAVSRTVLSNYEILRRITRIL